MKTIISIIVLLTICSSSLFAQDRNKKEKICITEQEYAVYDVVGVGNYQSETTNYPFWDRIESQFPNISSEAIADYNEKNSKTYLLRCLLRKDERKKLKKYYSTTTSLSLSRIGFNKNETEALVYVGWSGVGNTCESDFFHLKKENGKWEIVKKVMTVIC